VEKFVWPNSNKQSTIQQAQEAMVVNQPKTLALPSFMVENPMHWGIGNGEVVMVIPY
jgi:hypothetical protein